MEFAQQIKAARAALDWTRDMLFQRSGISVPTIKNVEEGRDVTGRTRRALIEALERDGMFLTSRGIERSEEKVVVFDSFVDVLENMKSSCQPGAGVLFHCADERRSTPPVTQAIAGLLEAGLQPRFTLCEGNAFTTTSPANYRWIDAEYFASSEVAVICGDKVAIDVSELGRDQFLLIKNRHVANAMRKQFEYWWKTGCPIGEKRNT